MDGNSVKGWAYREDINSKFRAAMEDGHSCKDQFNNEATTGLFSVFDGHGGYEAVDYCKERVPIEFQKSLNDSADDIFEAYETCFKKVDEQLKLAGAIQSGTTATVCLVQMEDNEKVLYVGNVGDTAAVLVGLGEAQQVTVDHKPIDQDEAQRITKSGGFIYKGRVAGQLAVTRALGDHQLKEEGVIGVP